MKNKGMYRLLSGVLCTSVLLSSQAYAAASADYSDFPQNWSKDAMEFAVKNNFITGVGEDKIAPKAALTRAQLAAILSRVMQTGAGDVSVLDNFTDADKNAWYAGAMAKAVELNILYGDGDSIYPDRPVTRQELFTILVRAFSVTGGDESTLASYNDAGSISSWAKAAISAMIAQGYAAGYEDKTLRPAQQVTREEFAQLLHRMREHYSSSDTSEDKTETKTDDTAKTDETTKTNTKKTSGGGGGGSSSGGGSHSGGGSVTVKKIVDETKATVQSTDMGTWLPLVFTDSYTFDTVASVKVGDMDVTAALSKVTTDGTIAKLALTGKPDKVMITAKDGKTQTITLNGTDGAAAVYTGKQYLPQRVLAHGAVAVWDYHLTNYDTEGNIRTEPKTTTFDLNKSVNARAFYSPDAELKEGEGFGKVSGEVIIKFNYNTAEEKAWFDGINTLQLAGYSERLESLNSNLEFNAKVATNKYGHYGQLTIELGQPNFFSNGRYYVRVKSTAGETVLVPIHVVNEKAPSMELTEMPESGKNLHFNVKDMTYGITSPIESVTLTDPNGKTEKLTYIEDYYLFGDTFVLYNDKENHLSHKGNYKLTISSNGFKTFETNFNVREGKEAEKTVVYQYAAYDVVTHATGGGSSSGGSSEDGGGSNTMPANLVFDTDLLANALLLHKMERTTADVEKIVNYWRYDINGRDSVFDKGATDYYKYSSYITAVNTAQTGNASWLSYEDYLKNAGEDAKNPNRPYAVKAILEDGLLGETQYNGDYGKLTAPDFEVGEAKEGAEVVLTTKDKDYVGEIIGLYLNGDWSMLRKDAYEIDQAAGTITIKAGVLKVGENTISIVATGYQKKTIKINNNKTIETDLTLSVNNESFKQGETATLTVEGSKGDFLKNLTGVALMKEGKVVKNVLYKGAEGSEAAYYEIDKNAADGNVLKLTLTAKEVEAGDYTVSLTANYYEEPLTVGFKVTAKDDSGEVTLTAPTVEKAELTKQKGLFEYCDYYRLRFGTISGTDLTAYLNKVTGVTVNGVTYTKESTYMKENTFRVKAEDDTHSTSAYDVLDLAANGVDTTKDIEIVIKADGYKNVPYTIAKTSGGGGTVTPDPNPDEGKLDAPTYTIQSATETGTYGSYNYYGVTFDGDTAASYVNAITGVTVATANGTETYKKSSTGYAEGNTYVLGGFMASNVLKLGEGGFGKNGKTTVTIKADGYKNLVINYGTDVTPPTKPESPEAKTAPEGKIEHKEADNYYQVSFNGNDVSDYLKAITSVKVGNTDYTATENYTPTGKQYSFGSPILPSLKLGAEGFTGSGDITVTITATDYKDNVVTYTMPSNGSDKDDNNAPDNDTMKVSECVKNRDGRYYLKFDGLDIRNFNITEVKVGENTYEELSLIWGNSKYSKAESKGQGIDCLELSANGFNASGETEIVIKGTVDGKEVTITYKAK